MSSNKNRIASQFIVHINTREEDGSSRVREFITYAGLLAVAHDIGLEEMNTTVVQMPTDGNGQTAVIRAIAEGRVTVEGRRVHVRGTPSSLPEGRLRSL